MIQNNLASQIMKFRSYCGILKQASYKITLYIHHKSKVSPQYVFSGVYLKSELLDTYISDVRLPPTFYFMSI